METIPREAAELTVDWLRDVMRGQDDSVPVVREMSTETVGAGLGLAGEIVRVTVSGASGETSYIAKFPPLDRQTRAIGNALHLYERESLFYRFLAHEAPVRVPHCYFNGCDAAADAYLLLLEDLAPAEVGDQIAGWSTRQAEAAVDTMAAVHARWWDRVDGGDLAWMPEWNGEALVAAVQGAYRQAWPAFEAKFGDALPDRLRADGGALADALPGLMDRIGAAPRTLVHGDFRMDNLFFSGAETPDVAVIDWQIACRGRGAFDLAYFLVQSGAEVARRESEAALIERYTAVLADAGVDGYGLNQCREDYRRCVLYSLVYPVISGGGMDLGNDRGVALIRAVTARTAAAIEDHACWQLVQGA